jgi:hypothetical protein
MVAPRGGALNAAPLRSRGSVLALLLVLAGVGVACDKVGLTAPTNTTITLFANATTVPLNGVTEITASVIEPAGTPVQNGTEVTFTASIGSIDPREARTQDGKVTARFTAGGTSGTAKIGAFSGSAKATEIELKVGGSAANRILLNAAPATVPSSGGSAEVLATVLDESGNRVSGVPVSFTTSAGSLSQTSVLTDGNGEARTILTTNREATVTATAGAASAQTVTVRVNTAPTITVTLSTQTPVAGQPVVFSVNVTANGAAIREVTLDFGDRDRLSLGALTGSTTVSHTYEEAGTYTVTATATDVSGERSTTITVINVQPATPLVVTLTTDSQPLVNTPTSIQVRVSPESTLIARYEYDFGDGTTAVLNSSQTNHIYTSVGRKTIRVTAVTVDGRRATGQTEILVRPADEG